MDIDFGNTPFIDAGELTILSDPTAKRNVIKLRRNVAGNIEVFSRRDGIDGDTCYTIREIQEEPLLWRYLGEGDNVKKLIENTKLPLHREFSETQLGSIADVVSKYSVTAMHRLEKTEATQ